MSIRLTDTQLVMLSAAAQRDDRCLVAPQNPKGSATQKLATKLIGAGLTKEIKAKPGAPVWRRDEQGGQSYALKLTAAGARASGDATGPALDETSEGTDPRVQVTMDLENQSFVDEREAARTPDRARVQGGPGHLGHEALARRRPSVPPVWPADHL